MMISSKRNSISKLERTISKSIDLLIEVADIEGSRYHVDLSYCYRVVEVLLRLDVVFPEDAYHTVVIVLPCTGERYADVEEILSTEV